MKKYITILFLVFTLVSCENTTTQVSEKDIETSSTDTKTVQTEQLQNIDIAQTEQTQDIEIETINIYNDIYNSKLFMPSNTPKEDISSPYFIGEFMTFSDEYGACLDENGIEYGFKNDYIVTLDYTLTFDDISASSNLSEEYNSENILKTDRLATWSEGVADDGIGEEIVINRTVLTQGNIDKTYTVTKNEAGAIIDYAKIDNYDKSLELTFDYGNICIVNGYAKNDTTWSENNRVRDLELYINDEYYGVLRLQDTIKPQYFELKDVNAKTMETMKFTFRIKDIYEGTKYNDTCLTGIKFGIQENW